MDKKKSVFRLLLALFVLAMLAAVWGAGEAYCRKLYGPMDTDNVAANQSKGFFAYSPVLGWRGNPNVSMRHNSGAWVTQNEHGFRDAPWDLDTKKPRVLLLGDSNMWGYGVNDDEYPAALLNRDYGQIRWFNAGMNGYGTDQEYLLFQKLKSEVKPDLTVLVMCENDRSENTSKRVRGYNKPYFELDKGKLVRRNDPVPAPERTDDLWVSSSDRVFRKTGSYLLYHVAQIMEARKNRSQQEEAGLAKRLGVSSSVDPTEALVSALNRATGGRLLVVLINSDEGVSARCRRESIPVLDMGETPVRQPGPNTYPRGRPKYGHWTPEGNRIAAKLIGQAVLEHLGGKAASSETDVAEPHVMVRNETGTELMEIRWVDAAGKDWGDRSLVAEYLDVNATSAVRLPPGVHEGHFAIRAIDPDGKDILWPPRQVTEGETIVLHQP